MQLLFEDLTSAQLHRSVKPVILSCFGDVAMSIGPHFEPYFLPCMGVLQQAAQIRAEVDNFEQIDYVNELREGIVEAYTGIIQGLKPHPSGEFFFGSVSVVLFDSCQSSGSLPGPISALCV